MKLPYSSPKMTGLPTAPLLGLSAMDRLCLLTCSLVLGLAVVLGAHQNAAVGERSIQAQIDARAELIRMEMRARAGKDPQDTKQ
jgi:hypothetical protein